MIEEENLKPKADEIQSVIQKIQDLNRELNKINAEKEKLAKRLLELVEKTTI